MQDFEAELSPEDRKQLQRHLRVVPTGRRQPAVIDYERSLRAALLKEKSRHLIDTQFRSQFRFSRILHTANVINDFFRPENFSGKRIADFGPGQFAFSLVARELGGHVIAVDKNEPFLTVAPLLGLEIVASDYYKASSGLFATPLDGLWLKGSFSALIPGGKDGISRFSEKLTAWIGRDGWGYIAPNNRTSKFQGKFGSSWVQRMDELIEHQRASLEQLGWRTYTLEGDDKRRYGMSSEPYDATRYIFIRNLDR